MSDDTTQSPGSLLADQMYATPEETPPETPVDETPPETPAGDPPSEDPPIAADDETPPDDQVSENEIEVQTMEQLVEHLECDPEWIQNLTINQTVRGKEMPVQLAEALATHRKVAAGDDYLDEAKGKAKTIIDEATQQKDQFSDSIVQFGALIQSIEADITADTKNIDWAKLRADDPAEYSARKEEVRERRERIDNLKKQGLETYNDAAGKIKESQDKARLERLPQEQEILLSKIPEWKDEEKAGKERGELVEYLGNEGYSPEDIQLASFNGKLLAMAVKAMRYDQSKSKSDAVHKKVVKIPKIMKPGTPPAPKPNGQDNDDPVSILYGNS